MIVLLFGYEHDPMVKAVWTSLEQIAADVAVWSPRDLLNDCGFVVR